MSKAKQDFRTTQKAAGVCKKCAFSGSVNCIVYLDGPPNTHVCDRGVTKKNIADRQLQAHITEAKEREKNLW